MVEWFKEAKSRDRKNVLPTRRAVAWASTALWQWQYLLVCPLCKTLDITSTAVNRKILLFPFTLCSPFLHPASMPQQKTTQCSCKLAGMFCAVCPKTNKKTNLQVPLRYEGRTKRSLFISCLPLVGIQHGRSLWEVSVQSRFLYSDVLHFTFSLCSPSEQCHSTPSVGTCGNVKGVFLCPPGYGTENTASVSDPGEKCLPSLKISLPEWQQNHSMCHIVPLSLKKKKKLCFFSPGDGTLFHYCPLL